MKADDRKQLQKNVLADKLQSTWKGVTSNSPRATLIWCVILVGLVAAIGWRWYSKSSTEKMSDLWMAVDRSGDKEFLQKIIDENKGTMPARVARFQIARMQAQDALSRLASTSSDERLTAAKNLEESRATYADLALDSATPPLLVQEAMMAQAKAEETLSGVPKENDPLATRGSLDNAAKLYAELALKHANSFQGEAAAKRQKEISEKRAEIEKFYLDLSQEFAKQVQPPNPVPALPLTPEKPAAEGPSLPLAEAPKADAPKSDDKPKS